MTDDKTTWAANDVLTSAFMNAQTWGNAKQYDLQSYPIPISGWHYADGDVVNATGAAGDPKLIMGGWGSGTGKLEGQDAHGTTKTETVYFDIALPTEYVNGQSVSVSVSARYSDTGTGTMSVKSLDCEAYEIAEAGTASADLCATAAKTLTTSMANYTFEVTPTNLASGDVLRVLLRIVLTESGGSGAQKAEFGGGGLLLDVKI